MHVPTTQLCVPGACPNDMLLPEHARITCPYYMSVSHVYTIRYNPIISVLHIRTARYSPIIAVTHVRITYRTTRYNSIMSVLHVHITCLYHMLQPDQIRIIWYSIT